jgi:hypothetical protein
MKFIASIEHLLALAKAEEQGKKIQIRANASRPWCNLDKVSLVTSAILREPEDFRIAPEPREHWSVFTAEGVYCESVFHESHAKEIAARINGTYAKFIEAL